MFALTAADLGLRVLDCPSGAAAFTAEVCARGGAATACDISYFDGGIERVAADATAEAVRGNDYVRAHREQYRWSFFTDPDHHLRVRRAASEQFAAHTRTDPHRYVPARLPTLPFADDSFDLVLSSHLLFSYADRLDYRFHLDAVTEMIRVTTGELRIFPLTPIGSTAPYARIAELRADLDTRGIATRITDVDYEFQTGGNQMLVCGRAARE
ncbi:methyltransferase domain-containing protein [Nocardia bovistercoris]|uniref:Methyltransferase domain-containing protein n=1 Tax=Nocardia bovistercoris TaxID=2785916 RepID=A0A931IAI0_9NOCA|nr:methyltransferase domain-containing protein [Nocardia bovistercoris]MBH0777774.1 methyltransferase domain-containing protein [Nocardia bovistercoris]